MKQSFVMMLAAVAIIRCGTGVSYSTATGTLAVLNGTTNAVSLMAKAGTHKLTAALTTPDGDYALSPSKMTMTVTGIAFLPPGNPDEGMPVIPLSGCTATYDRSIGSLAVLRSSDITVPVGTFAGISIEYSSTFSMVMNDSVAGIYSNPDAANLLTTTAPAGGGRPIQVKEGDGNRDHGNVKIYFASPITIDKNSAPHVYVVFDPTHWARAGFSNGSFSAPHIEGEPPIIPSISSFGKAAFYSNIGTSMSYNWGARTINSGMSLLFLYADDTTPVMVTWRDFDICTSMGGAPVAAFNGNGTLNGTFGMLGRDSNHTLAWASAGGPSSGNENVISGYTGVYRMQEVSTIGQTTVVSYLCTNNVPQPVSGRNYSSGAPDFTPSGTLTLTLLAN